MPKTMSFPRIASTYAFCPSVLGVTKIFFDGTRILSERNACISPSRRRATARIA